jgi:putative ABC transport system substrate-binding protein
MRRRDFLTLLGATAAAWPLAARGQQDGRVRRIGILEFGLQSDRVTQLRQGALREGLAKQGWIEGRNVRFDVRYFEDDPDRMRAHADELVRLAPDVIVVSSRPGTLAVMQRTRTIPIVFINIGDPLIGGIVKSVARPEGNVTGATGLFESIASKWLEMLKEASPRTARAALLFVPEFVFESYLVALDNAAAVLGVKAIRTPYRGAAELEHAIDAFAAEPDGGLIVMPPAPRGSNRELINQLALKYRLPTIGPNKYDAADIVMMSYGPDGVEVSRVAATYVDRILRGAKISELPVQFPTKFELIVNLKAAKAIGLTIPETFLLRADEVIE